MSDWWRSAVIYQVYIRSFRDLNGDGLGDVAGIRERLPYLRDLGVDAIWITPWYPSPMADAGYDVSEYCDIEPQFGTLAEGEALITEAHEHGIRVILDIVPNHTSEAHPWFQEALAAAPGSPSRDRYIFRDGRGDGGSEPPTDWPSVFGGSAWTRTTAADGNPGEWYLNLFDSSQPDLNWENDDVRAEMARVLRFWFDRGVDGFRIDVAHGMVKDPAFPDLGADDNEMLEVDHREDHPYWDRDGVHEIYREWRAIADSYDPPRIFVAEAWVRSGERLSRYLRPDELHTGFNFDYLTALWQAEDLRAIITSSIAEAKLEDSPSTWVLSNHDVVRHVSRYARAEQITKGHHLGAVQAGGPADLELGLQRARAAILLMLALPGCAYVYQGEELGLEEVEDLPEETLQDPSWCRTNERGRVRDGCRVPIPWGDEADDVQPWLPQPAHWAGMSAAAQEGDPDSMLELYRRAIALRREHLAGAGQTITWNASPEGTLSFTRGGVTCLVNVSAAPVELPVGAGVSVLVRSDRADEAHAPLGRDAAVWLG